jgi:dTDP-4-amino-4,6-dideoxygalactose transaminase
MCEPDILVSTSDSLETAVQRLNRFAALILVDADGRPLREIRSAHVRRMLRAGFPASDPLSAMPAGRAPAPALPAARADGAQAEMVARDLEAIALVDDVGRAVGVRLRDHDDDRILLSPPHMDGEEEDEILAAFDSNWIAPVGPHIDAFEAELGAYVDAPALAVVSGTAALHLALRLAGIGPGDVVAASSLTFIGSVAPIMYCGARPIFVDSDAATWNMSAAALDRALDKTRRAGAPAKAVVVTHIYGQCADLDALQSVCAAYDAVLIEDAAESLGATYKGAQSGAFGAFGAYSFNGNKIITTSGGGALVANDPEAIARARFLATQARDPAGHYEHSTYGYNYRMSNLLAGVGRAQLRRLDDRVERRRATFAAYYDVLDGAPGLSWMPEAPYGRSNRWLSVAMIDPAAGPRATPEAVIAALAEAGVEARRVWKPMHLQPVFQSAPYEAERNGSFSDACFDRGVCLPSGSALTPGQIDRICAVLRATLS